MLKLYFKILFVGVLAVLAPVGFALASITDGTIDSANKYAWGENIGWVNFGAAQSNAHITDAALTGYAWSANYGWINLAPATAGVTNDGSGDLSGQAWGANLGWLDFSGVAINSSGEFEGYAVIENDNSRISFNCSNTSSCASSDFKLKTDWRPRSVRPQCNNAIDDDNDGKIDYPADSGCSSLEDTDETDAVSNGAAVLFSSNIILAAPVEKIQEIVSELPKKIEEIKNKTAETLKPLIKKAVKSPLSPLAKRGVAAVPETAPSALKGEWPLIPEGPINNFALSPLTRELSLLLKKFPELENTFVHLGVNKIDDLAKLEGIKLILPGLTEALGLSGGAATDGGIVLSGGIPLNQLPPAAKEKIPTEIIFAKSAGQLVDFNMELTVAKTGETQSKINIISGHKLSLLVRPENQAKSVKGSIIFKSKTVELNSGGTLAGALNNLAVKPALAETEQRLVLAEFNYNDDDNDGIWTADIEAPIVQGKYEIITKINYQDEKLAAKEIRLITVVDPEGYIYKKSGQDETRLSGAAVSLFWLNPQNNNFELWLAEKFQQANPQTTDITGRYSFLAPAGDYYLKVNLAGYKAYQGERFTVKAGHNIHFNIELKPKFWNFKTIDWKTTFLIIILTFLILYNFYRDRKRKA